MHPQVAHGDDDDNYTPLIRLLHQLRRRERYRNYLNSYYREETTAGTASTAQDTVTAEPSNRISNSQAGSGADSFSNPDAIRKLIQDSQSQTAGGGSSSSVSNFDTTRRPALVYDPLPVTKVPVQRIEQINRGVSTILNGVGSASLDQILRGSFMFTRNENVRSVANNVLDAIFGRRNQ